MAKFSVKVPPSATETIVTVDVPDAIATIRQEAPLFSQSGGTPIPPVVEPPVTTPPVDPPTTGARKNLILESLFDTTDLATAIKGWSDEQRVKNAYSLKVVNKTLRYELHPGDFISGSCRAEITKEVSGRIMFGGRLFLEDFTADSKAGGESIGIQFHSSENAPPLTLNLYGSDVVLAQVPTGSIIQNKLGTISDWTNKWMDIVLETDWKRSGGVLRMWVNGKKVVDKTGLDMGASNVNVKLGMNKFSWYPSAAGSNVKSRVFYWDSVRIGNASATYDDVKP